jgi:hypothetical protein
MSNTIFHDELFGNKATNGQQGKNIYVKPYSGSDGQRGDAPIRSVATLAKAQSLATADKNDRVLLMAESNTAAYTTDYQSEALDWAKDGVHLLGVNAGNRHSQRSRIAQLSTATNVDNLFTVSADGCLIENISVHHGVADATSKGAVLVSGSRNHFRNCHFAGIGDNTMDTAANYSLSVTGSENFFEDCVIGLDTVARGTAATYEMIMSGNAARNIFKNCVFNTFAEAAGFVFLSIGSAGIDRYVMFDNCTFINATQSSATLMTAAMTIHDAAAGHVILKDCMLIGATDWTATDSSVVQLLGHTYNTDDVNMGIASSVDVTA